MHAVAEATAAVVDSEEHAVAGVNRLVRAARAVRLQDGVDEGAVTRLAGAHPAVRRADDHRRGARRPANPLDAVCQPARRRYLPHDVRRALGERWRRTAEAYRCQGYQNQASVPSHLVPPVGEDCPNCVPPREG